MTTPEVCPKCGGANELLGSDEYKERPGIVFHPYKCISGHALAIEETRGNHADV